MGQVNRVDSARLAVARAGEDRARGSVAASDAFFPFPDGLRGAARRRGPGGRPAGWLGARRRGGRRCRGRRGDDVPHRDAPLLPLTRSGASRGRARQVPGRGPPPPCTPGPRPPRTRGARPGPVRRGEQVALPLTARLSTEPVAAGNTVAALTCRPARSDARGSSRARAPAPGARPETEPVAGAAQADHDAEEGVTHAAVRPVDEHGGTARAAPRSRRWTSSLTRVSGSGSDATVAANRATSSWSTGSASASSTTVAGRRSGRGMRRAARRCGTTLIAAVVRNVEHRCQQRRVGSRQEAAAQRVTRVLHAASRGRGRCDQLGVQSGCSCASTSVSGTSWARPGASALKYSSPSSVGTRSIADQARRCSPRSGPVTEHPSAGSTRSPRRASRAHPRGVTWLAP